MPQFSMRTGPRSVVAVAALACLTSAGVTAARAQELKPMDPAAHPHFEVATIKPADPADRSSGFHTSGARIFIENERMSDIVSMAYDVHARQLLNTPDWFSSERFDIKGTADVEGIPDLRQQQEMLRALLEERLGLKLHKEERAMPHFALVVAAGGPKLKQTSSTDTLPDQTGNVSDGQEDWRFTNNSMDDFARFLRFVLERPVIDETHLPGRFDFHLHWQREAAAANDPDPLSGVVSALPEQAGLKVETVKGPLPMLVIEKITRPSEN